MANRQVSGKRKTVFYIGMALSVLGLLTFGSVFVSGILSFGNFDNFESRAISMGIRALLGIVMAGAGGICMVIGRAGLAGSGMVLDPEQARKDYEPWARMTGGVIKDALDEADIDLSGFGKTAETEDYTDRIRKLHQLLQDDIITKEEFEREKKEILDSN